LAGDTVIGSDYEIDLSSHVCHRATRCHKYGRI
jgi:hypothetical protein